MAVSGMTYVFILSVISVLLLSHYCNAATPTATTKLTPTPTPTTKAPTSSPAPTGSSSTGTMPPKTTASKSSGYVTFSASLLIGASFLALKMQH